MNVQGQLWQRPRFQALFCSVFGSIRTIPEEQAMHTGRQRTKQTGNFFFFSRMRSGRDRPQPRNAMQVHIGTSAGYMLTRARVRGRHVVTTTQCHAQVHIWFVQNLVSCSAQTESLEGPSNDITRPFVGFRGFCGAKWSAHGHGVEDALCGTEVALFKTECRKDMAYEAASETIHFPEARIHPVGPKHRGALWIDISKFPGSVSNGARRLLQGSRMVFWGALSS